MQKTFSGKTRTFTVHDVVIGDRVDFKIEGYDGGWYLSLEQWAALVEHYDEVK